MALSQRLFRIMLIILLQAVVATSRACGAEVSWLDPDRTEPAGTQYQRQIYASRKKARSCSPSVL